MMPPRPGSTSWRRCSRRQPRTSQVAPLLAALLSIPAEPRYPPVNLTPEAQKLRTFDALLGQVVGLAGRRPVLMVLEDAHWIDPTSAELFGLVIDRTQHLPVLLLITFRAEFTSPWTGYAHVTSLSLSRLGQRQGAHADLLLHTERAAVVCRLYSAEALWFLGFPDRARARIESGLALAQRLAHVNGLAF
jgi:hypothetical protein